MEEFIPVDSVLLRQRLRVQQGSFLTEQTSQLLNVPQRI